LVKNTIQTTIINDSRRVECEAECGIDWSSPEALTLATQRINERFGERIKLTYLDLSKAVAGEDTRRWNEAIREKNLPVPLLLVNGQIRISGNFDIRQLLDVIEVETEMGV
jgi:disulfide oxidoreductase YuzD